MENGAYDYLPEACFLNELIIKMDEAVQAASSNGVAMGFLSSLEALSQEHIPTPEERAELGAVKKTDPGSMQAVRGLFSANKTALEILGDIEALGGTRPFGMEYIRAPVRAMSFCLPDGAKLNSLTGNAYRNSLMRSAA